jgi:hypothetical protein
MLGRYVAGTVLVLGVAMLMAPPPPEREAPRAVAPPRAAPEPVAEAPAPQAPAPEDVAEPAELRSGIEDAVAAALALDASEGSVGDGVDAQGGSADTGANPLTPPAAGDGIPLAELQGLAPAEQPSAQGIDLPVEQSLPVEQDGPEPVVLYVTGTEVNVRAGPSTEYRVVGTVGRGEAVELLGSEDGWAQILFGQQRFTGFMSRQFLDYDPSGG